MIFRRQGHRNSSNVGAAKPFHPPTKMQSIYFKYLNNVTTASCLHQHYGDDDDRIFSQQRDGKKGATHTDKPLCQETRFRWRRDRRMKLNLY